MHQRDRRTQSTSSPGPGPGPAPGPTGSVIPSLSTALFPSPQPTLTSTPRRNTAPNGGGGAPSGLVVGATGGGLAGAAVGMSTLRQRMQDLQQARSNPSSVPRSSRLGAYTAFTNPAPGTVGMGARSGIESIYLLWGSNGQAGIGNYFNHPAVQQLARHPAGPALSPSPQNLAVGQGEHTVWTGQRSGRPVTVFGTEHQPSADAGRTLRNEVAVRFGPTPRAFLQSVAARNPRLFPVAAAMGVVSGRTAVGVGAGGAAGEIVDRVRARFGSG